MRMTTGLVAKPIGTDMMAACTLVNCPLPSCATVISVTRTLPAGLVAVLRHAPNTDRVSNRQNNLKMVFMNQCIRDKWNASELPIGCQARRSAKQFEKSAG